MSFGDNAISRAVAETHDALDARALGGGHAEMSAQRVGVSDGWLQRQRPCPPLRHPMRLADVGLSSRQAKAAGAHDERLLHREEGRYDLSCRRDRQRLLLDTISDLVPGSVPVLYAEPLGSLPFQRVGYSAWAFELDLDLAQIQGVAQLELNFPEGPERLVLGWGEAGQECDEAELGQWRIVGRPRQPRACP